MPFVYICIDSSCCVTGLHSAEARFGAAVRDEVHEQSSVPPTRRPQERPPRSGNPRFPRPPLSRQLVVFFPR